MKNSTLRTIFEWALATSLLLSVIFFWQYFMRTRQGRAFQPTFQAEMAKFQNNHMMLNVLQNDLNEYIKTHPDLKTYLEAKPAASAAAAKPAAK